MRYYVIREWCLIEDENEEDFDRCVIGHATENDEENDGKNFFGVSGGFDFNIYDSIKEAIVNTNYSPCEIIFEDFTEAELNEANTIISDLCNDAEFMKNFQSKIEDEGFAKVYPTWIIAYCPDTNSFFATNQRCFFWEYEVEFESEHQAVDYFKNHLDEFWKQRKNILDSTGGWSTYSKMYLENTKEFFQYNKE